MVVIVATMSPGLVIMVVLGYYHIMAVARVGVRRMRLGVVMNMGMRVGVLVLVTVAMLQVTVLVRMLMVMAVLMGMLMFMGLSGRQLLPPAQGNADQQG